MHMIFNKWYMPQGNTSADSYPGLNAAKGLLIIMVIFTHCLPNSMLLFFNYYFHMPVFMAISGFLLKKSVFKNGLRSYLEKVLHRLVVPWLLACCIYLPFQLGTRSVTDITLTDFLYPYYHLWYIPAYIIAAVLCYGICRFKLRPRSFLLFTALVTAVWYVLFRDKGTPVSDQPFYYLGEKRYYAYTFFFLLGFCLRNNLIQVALSPLLLVASVVTSFALIVVTFYTHQPDTLTVILYLLFNTSLVLLLLLFISRQNWLQYKFLLLVNKQSLGVYLYHPFIIFSIYQLVGHPDRENITNLQGFAVGFVVIAIIMPFIWLVKKWDLSGKIILGIVKK